MSTNTPQANQTGQPEPDSGTTPEVGRRIASAILNYVIFAILFIILISPNYFYEMITGSPLEAKPIEEMRLFDFYWEYAIILCVAIFLSRDVLNGRGLPKRILRLQVLDNKTGLPASPVKTVIRNLGELIWVVEGIMIVISPARRVGDYVANTRLVQYKKETVPPKKYSFLQTLPAFGLAFVIVFILTFPLQSLSGLIW